LRGVRGAITCFVGLMGPPLVLALIYATIYFHLHGMPGERQIGVALSGMGAVAIGLNLGTGIRLARRGIRRVLPGVIAAIVALTVGVAGIALLKVLAVMIPVSLLVAWWTQPA
jgi:chromate transporter